MPRRSDSTRGWRKSNAYNIICIRAVRVLRFRRPGLHFVGSAAAQSQITTILIIKNNKGVSRSRKIITARVDCSIHRYTRGCCGVRCSAVLYIYISIIAFEIFNSVSFWSSNVYYRQGLTSYDMTFKYLRVRVVRHLFLSIFIGSYYSGDMTAVIVKWSHATCIYNIIFNFVNRKENVPLAFLRRLYRYR
jgi:hypothetical protein